MSADYLFQRDKHYDVCYDTGDKVIQCGRHNDIFKFWLMWRSKGMDGFSTQIDRLMELTAYQVKRMKEYGEKFHLLLDEPECTNVIFWYVPERLRARKFPQAYTRDWHIELGKVSFLTVLFEARLLKNKDGLLRSIIVAIIVVR